MLNPIITIDDFSLQQLKDNTTDQTRNWFKKVVNIDFDNEEWYIQPWKEKSEFLLKNQEWLTDKNKIQLDWIHSILSIDNFFDRELSNKFDMWVSTFTQWNATQSTSLTDPWENIIWFNKQWEETFVYRWRRHPLHYIPYTNKIPFFWELWFFNNTIYYSSNFNEIRWIYIYKSNWQALNVQNWNSFFTFDIWSNEWETWELKVEAWTSFYLFVEEPSHPRWYVFYFWDQIQLIETIDWEKKKKWKITLKNPWNYWNWKRRFSLMYETHDNFKLYEWNRWTSTKLYRPFCNYVDWLFVWDWRFVYKIYQDSLHKIQARFSWFNLVDWRDLHKIDKNDWNYDRRFLTFMEWQMIVWEKTTKDQKITMHIPQYPLELQANETVKQLLEYSWKLLILFDENIQDDFNDPYNSRWKNSYIWTWWWELDPINEMRPFLHERVWFNRHIWWLTVDKWIIYWLCSSKDEFWWEDDVEVFRTNLVDFESLYKIKVKRIKNSWKTFCWVHSLVINWDSIYVWVWWDVDWKWLYRLDKVNNSYVLTELYLNEDITWVFKTVEKWDKVIYYSTKNWTRYITDIFSSNSYIETIDYDLSYWNESWIHWRLNTYTVQWISLMFKDRLTNWYVKVYYKIDDWDDYTYLWDINSDNQDEILFWINERWRKISIKLEFFSTNWNNSSIKLRKINIF